MSPVGTIAIIGGTGKLGMGLAGRLAAAGVAVIVGSREVERAVAAAATIRGGARGLLNQEAARAGDTVIIAVPYQAHRATLESLTAVATGKVVLDAAVPLASGGGLQIERPRAGSLAEETQQMLVEAKVAAAFHTVSAGMLRDLRRPLLGDVLICADDPDARDVAARVVGAVGMRPVDAGGLAHAHALEHLAALLLAMNRRYKRGDLGITIAGL